MWGSRNPRNILLESDCSFHESCEDSHTHYPSHYQPPRPICTDRICSEAYGSRDIRGYTSPRESVRPSTTPSESSIRDYTRKTSFPVGKYSDGKYSEKGHDKHNHARPIQPAGYDGKFTTGADIQSNSSAPQGDYHKQFRQGIADNVHGTPPRRGTSMDDCSWQDVKNTRCRSNENKCSRDKPEGTSFSCNDCMEPQCLYCWRKLRDAKGDFSFLDQFETQEQKWKPSIRHVDQLNNFHTVHNQHNSSSSKSLEDRLHSEIHKHRSSSCHSSCPPEEPKWKPTNSIHENQEGHEPIEHQNARCEPPSRENQWPWPLGKGRGMGPVPGEWVPPFRRFSSEYPAETFQRSKGPGAMPNSDDWVPPFRGEEQPYSWHRCKGSGGCPPRDQWHAPWSDSIKNKGVGQAYGDRGENTCLDYPEVSKSWREDTREVY